MGVVNSVAGILARRSVSKHLPNNLSDASRRMIPSGACSVRKATHSCGTAGDFHPVPFCFALSEPRVCGCKGTTKLGIGQEISVFSAAMPTFAGFKQFGISWIYLWYIAYIPMVYPRYTDFQPHGTKLSSTVYLP